MLYIAAIYLLVYERIPVLSSRISLSRLWTFVAVQFSMERATLKPQVLLVSVHQVGNNNPDFRIFLPLSTLKSGRTILHCNFSFSDFICGWGGQNLDGFLSTRRLLSLDANFSVIC